MDILYRDDVLVAVDKPAGLAVHRGWAGEDDVAMTRVRDSIGRWVYPVHRLDRGASGVLLFALSSDAARAVCGSFERREVAKRYIALVRGVPPAHRILEHPIPRRPGGPRVPAVTEIRLIEQMGRYAVVSARPRTGRLHQIRRHLKHLSCPIIGDVKYGKGDHNRLFRERFDLHRLALHAASLELRHPVTGESIRLEAALHPDVAGAVEKLSRTAGKPGIPPALWAD